MALPPTRAASQPEPTAAVEEKRPWSSEAEAGAAAAPELVELEEFLSSSVGAASPTTAPPQRNDATTPTHAAQQAYAAGETDEGDDLLERASTWLDASGALDSGGIAAAEAALAAEVAAIDVNFIFKIGWNLL